MPWKNNHLRRNGQMALEVSLKKSISVLNIPFGEDFGAHIYVYV